MKKIAFLLFILFLAKNIYAQKDYNAQNTGNPILPGYFADPTIKKFGDTYYLYATTDGSGAGFGPAQVWSSKDFVNWTLMPMNWPDSHWIWAPDVMQDKKNGKFYLFYCQPCIIHCGVSDTPRGPWKNILGESEAVLVPDRFVKNAITLDGQTFVDDDGSVYLYWGTWGIYKGFGCGAGKLNPDMKTFAETRLIPNTEATDFFEAPFVLKRNGIYYFMYSSGSCHDNTYRVQYATSDKPLGPYKYQGCILETTADGTIHGPGHHSVLQEGNDYYIIYHRHDNPHSNRGFHRQICADKLIFNADGTINKIAPTHDGIGALAKATVNSENIALGCKVRASSFYDKDFRPEYAVDNNNGTLWRPRTDGQEWLEIDLGKNREIRTIWTQFEYGTSYYQYVIETSVDGKKWDIFADKRDNMLAGSPMVDFGKCKARFIRISGTGGQKNGFPCAIWNIKVFSTVENSSPQLWLGLSATDWNGIEWKNNGGMLGGSFTLQEGNATIKRIDGKYGLVLEPGSTLVYCNDQLSPDKEHTISALNYENGKWVPIDMEQYLSKGKITIKSKDRELTITNLRYYNHLLYESEKVFDQTNDIVHTPKDNNLKKRLIVDLSANDFNNGDTVAYIPNKVSRGTFIANKKPAMVETKDGKKAFHFDGEQIFRSDFALSNSIMNNSSYTLEAWILNPEMELNECVADFTSSHDELEKIMLVNGTEPRCGFLNHYGWYEDAGSKDAKRFEGKWQHIYVCFDGRIEKVYINGEKISEKDIQIIVKPSQYITLGLNAEGDWPFNGYIHSIKLWDEYIPYK